MPINHQHVNDGTTPNNTAAADWNASHTIGDKLTNANAGTVAAGSPVYISAAGSFDLAKADNAATAECIGLVPADVAHAAQGLAQEVDSVTLTTGQWDARTGGSGGLTPGARYWLSATTAGALVATPPSTAGQFVVPIGRALTTTTMRLRVESPIGL